MINIAKQTLFLSAINCFIELYCIISYAAGADGFAYVWTRSGFAPVLLAIGMFTGFSALMDLKRPKTQ